MIFLVCFRNVVISKLVISEGLETRVAYYLKLPNQIILILKILTGTKFRKISALSIPEKLQKSAGTVLNVKFVCLYDSMNYIFFVNCG